MLQKTESLINVLHKSIDECTCGGKLSLVARNSRAFGIKDYMNGELDRCEISHLSCNRCYKTFMVDWSYPVPVPMVNRNLVLFKGLELRLK